MALMNSSEVEEAVVQFRDNPVLAPAARYLDAFRELIDDNSDGWAYWSYGTKCANDLCKILYDARGQFYGSTRYYVPPTAEQVKKAVQKIRTFVLRCKQLEGIQPPVFQG